MKITVKVYPINSNSKLKANASINIDDTIIINNFKIIKGTKGLFVSNPNHEHNGKYYDYAYCLTKEKTEKLHNLILSEYEKNLNNVDNEDVDAL